MRDFISILVLSLLFAGSLLHPASHFSWTLFWGAMLGIFITSLWLRQRNLRLRQEFLNQLKKEKREILRGGAVLIDEEIYRKDTVLSSYQMSVGAIFSSVNLSSPFSQYHGYPNHQALFYSLASLATGWLALPFGPAITLTFIAKNLTGGNKKNVQDLLEPNNERPIESKVKAIRSDHWL